MTERIRPAAAADVDTMAALATLRRSEYAQYRPVFWRPAAKAEQKHRLYLAQLIASDDAVALVSEDSGHVTGFVILTLAAPPPVYDPGGLTGLIDDFAVLPGRWLTTGMDLLRAALDGAVGRGAAQVVVVTAQLDKPKRQMLKASGLEVASEWWTAPLPSNADHSDGPPPFAAAPRG